MSVVSSDMPKTLANASAVSESRLKRLLDVIVALMALLFLLPLLLLVSFMIVMDSRGPVFFRQRRTGLHGREFRIFKFRSMRVMEDGEQVQQATQKDDRVTRIGAMLRRSSIDELPQLLNVLQGDMSLVGPRPHALAHDQHFGALVPDYVERFRARPGITGLAQVKGLRGEIRSLDQMVRRVENDNTYIAGWHIGRDISIIAQTLVIAPFHRDVY